MTDLSSRLVGYALKQAQHALHRRMEDALRPLNMTPAQFAVMMALRGTPNQTNADLAEAAFLTPQSMQGVLAKLETAGLVERRPDQSHGRRQLARLTRNGLTLTTQAEDRVRPIEATLREAALPATSDDMLAMLERLRDAMQSFSMD